MRPTLIAALALVSSLVAVPAFAAPSAGAARTEHAVKDGQHEGKDAKFPMPAADFKQRIDTRLAKARAHMEERASKLPADQAKEVRAKFDAGAAKVNAEVAKATADGTVTKDEAKAVRETVKEVRGHHGKHARNKNGKRAKKSAS